MKLVVAGATGFVGTEVVRQALSIPSITSVVALGRRETSVPEKLHPGTDTSKFKSLVVPDFNNYSQDAKAELADADACVWTIGVLPKDLKTMSEERIRDICYNYTVANLDVFTASPRPAGKKPFRFIYVSGAMTQRDPAKKPWIMGDYCLLRGEVETEVLAYGQKHSDRLESFVVKPGFITSPDKAVGYGTMVLHSILKVAIGLPFVENINVAASCLSLAMDGSTTSQDTFSSDEMGALGQEFAQKYNIAQQ